MDPLGTLLSVSLNQEWNAGNPEYKKFYKVFRTLVGNEDKSLEIDFARLTEYVSVSLYGVWPSW